MLTSKSLVDQEVAIDNLSDLDWDAIVDCIAYFVVVAFHHTYIISEFLIQLSNRPYSWTKSCIVYLFPYVNN